MRAQLVVRPTVVGALTGFAFVASGMLGQALAADIGNQPIVNTACTAMPVSATLDAQMLPAGRPKASSPASGSTASRSAATAHPKTASAAASDPSPGDSSSPSPSDSASTDPAASPTDTSSAPSTTPTSADPSPTATDTSPTSTPTPSASPTSGSPTPTPTPSTSSPAPKPKTPQLCVRVQPFSAASRVKPGKVASFAVWVWSTKATGRAVTVKVSVAAATGVHAPAFTVCPAPSRATCKMGNVPTGQADELQVAVRVGKQAVLGEQVQLTAKVSATKAKGFTGSATDVVAAATTSATAPGTSPLTGGALPPVTLPPIPGDGVSPGDPSGLFPTVGPAPSASTTPLGLPSVKPHKTVRVTDAAATVPLDSRLIGGQLAGLAVLAGAVVLAIARLSLRSPKPAEDKGGDRPPSA